MRIPSLSMVSIVLWAISLGSIQYAGSAAVGADWPQWRGPHGDGISRETGLLIDWREKAPRLVWQRPLGTGFSSFSVANGRLYTLAASDNIEHVLCLDAESGETLWKVPSGSTYQDRQGGDGPRSTPTVVGEVVYGLGAEGELLCLAKETGEVRWRRNVLNDFQGENLRWGVSTSPYVDQQRLLVNNPREVSEADALAIYQAAY